MTVAVQLIHREDLERRQRAGAHRVTAQLEKLWTEYESDKRIARSLLGTGCRAYGILCTYITVSSFDIDVLVSVDVV